MTLLIISIFVALLIGMAISVGVFGTAGKRKKVFQDIYFSVEDCDGIGVIFTKTGEYSAVLRMDNPVPKHSANIDSYYEFSTLFTGILQSLGEGYALHKQDIFVRKDFNMPDSDKKEFLSKSYFTYFDGRRYTETLSYLVITQEAKKAKLFSYDPKKWKDFLVKLRKVSDQLRDAGISARFLTTDECTRYVDRFFAVDFANSSISMNNFRVDDEEIGIGNRKCKVFSLVDVDCASLPPVVRPYSSIEVNNSSMPVDLLSAIDSIPDVECTIFNQMIFMPNQKREMGALEKKKNRHSSMPNPSNQIAVEDIKQVQEVIALDPSMEEREKTRLVNGKISEIAMDYPNCTVSTEYIKTDPIVEDTTDDTIHLLWSSDRLEVARQVERKLTDIYVDLVSLEKMMHYKLNIVNYLMGASPYINDIHGKKQTFIDKGFTDWMINAAKVQSSPMGNGRWTDVDDQDE